MREMSRALIRLKVRARIEKLLGVQVMQSVHHGHRDSTDVKRSGCRISVVFDVGANVGQSACKFKLAFPGAKIYCFEPVKETFEILKRNVNCWENVKCHQLAFGSREGEERIY